jgi:hypothetical protein
MGSEDDVSLLLWQFVEECLVEASDTAAPAATLRRLLRASVDRLMDILTVEWTNRSRVRDLLNLVSLAFQGSYDTKRGPLIRSDDSVAKSVPDFVVGMVLKPDRARELLSNHERSIAGRKKTTNPDSNQVKRGAVHLDTTDTVPLLSAIASLNLSAASLNQFAREIRRVWSSSETIEEFRQAFFAYTDEEFHVPTMIRDVFQTHDYFRTSGSALYTAVVRLSDDVVAGNFDTGDVVNDDAAGEDDTLPRQSVRHGAICADLVRMARIVLSGGAGVESELEHEWAIRFRSVLKALDDNLPFRQLPAIVRRVVDIVLTETIVPLGDAAYCLQENQTEQEYWQTVAAVTLTVIAHCDLVAMIPHGYMRLSKNLRDVLAVVWTSTNQAGMDEDHKFLPGFSKLYSFAGVDPPTKERQLRQFRPLKWAPGQRHCLIMF